MASLPSFPGRGSFADLQLGDHLCLPVSSDTERLCGTVEFTGLGLRRDAKVIIFSDTETPDELAAHLPTLLPDAVPALAAGQVQVVPCRDIYLAGGAFDPGRTLAGFVAQVELAVAQGYSGLWLAVDVAWSLSGLPDTHTLVAWEAAANATIAEHPVTAMCVYDRTRFCPALLERVYKAHPMTPGQAPLRFARTLDPPGLLLSGEVDLTNHDALAALLCPLHTMPGHITIDATGLHFADLRAADLLSGVRAARRQCPTTIIGSTALNRVLELAEKTRPAEGRRPHA
ncbi:MAG TPA: MEDS domain-containing protein [Pseudonocardiaceae bacterium]